MDLKIDISRSGISQDIIAEHSSQVEAGLEKLWSGKEAFTGWVNLPLQRDEDELERLLYAAIAIQDQCQELIVIGIGGSYLGAAAVINALVGFDRVYGTDIPADIYPKVRFAGNNLSATYLNELVEDVRTRNVSLCVISKSGSTMEPALAFSVLKDELIKKYGKENAAQRIYVVTDEKEGILRAETEREGYTSFVIPKDIGGRYSVLTPAGLLPIAAAGVDIKELLAGATAMATSTDWDFSGGDYAAVRYALMNGGKQIEIFEYYEPQLEYFAEWLKQLFAESEGKEGTGLFPVALKFSTDLHSMGQFLQEGSQIFFETVLNVVKPCSDIILPRSDEEWAEGRSLNEVNKIAMEGVMKAHEAVGIPIIKIDIPEINPFYMGQMIYFFETICGITAYMMEINPFNQPGVELYKKEMQKILNNYTK